MEIRFFFCCFFLHKAQNVTHKSAAALINRLLILGGSSSPFTAILGRNQLWKSKLATQTVPCRAGEGSGGEAVGVAIH